MIYLLTIVFYANSIPFLFCSHSTELPPTVIFLSDRATYSRFPVQVHFALRMGLCLSGDRIVPLSPATLKHWPVRRRYPFICQTRMASGNQTFFFHSKASLFYFILFYFEILKKLLNLESEFPAASMWMYVTFPSLLVRTL